MSLNKSYGASTFEVNDFKVTFTGKVNQHVNAAKIKWILREDGTIAVALADETIALGSYKFDITPVIKCQETGAKLELKKTSVTVAVENKAIKATAKTGGKIDLLDRENSGIIYTVDLSDKKLDRIDRIELMDAVTGMSCSSLFEIEEIEKNGSTAKVAVRAKTEEELSTKVTYNMQLLVTTQKQKECYIPIKIKPTQSAIKLSTSTKSITLYKQVKDTDAPEIQISAVSGAKPPKNLVIKNVSAGNQDFKVAYATESGSMKLIFANDAAKAKYKAKATVKVPVYIQVEDQASDVTVKTEITVTVKN